MGLFSSKVDATELVAREENRKRLASFQVTDAWGVKKEQTAMQFIYDGNQKCFVVVEGPVDTFRNREPWVVDFDQVEDVYLDVDEWWTETNEKFAPRGYGILTQDKYKDVFWRYDFYMVIETTHPYAKTIRYKMNSSDLITKVQGLHLLVRRGWELSGNYKDEKIMEQITKMEELKENETKALARERGLDLVLLKNKDEGILEGVVKDMVEDRRIKRIDFAITHMKRVLRVRKLIMGA